MMEITQPSRPQAGTAKTTETRSDSAPAEGREAAEFDQHLQRQMAPSEPSESPRDKPVKSVKTDKNQQLDDDVRSRAEVLPAVPQEPQQLLPLDQPGQPASQQPAAGVMAEQAPLLQTDSDGLAEDSASPVAGEQSLPQDGKALPPVAVAATPLVSDQQPAPVQVAGEQAAAAGDRPRPQPAIAAPLAQPQAAATSPTALAEPADGNQPLPAEFRAALKNSQAPSAEKDLPVTARTSLHMASLASAASSMQQVPLTTSLASLHNHGAGLPPADGLQLPSAPLSTSLPTPVQHPAWSQGVAERVAWMVQGNFQSAELKLNPAHLGPLEIKLALHDDNKATIHFVTSHAAVRDALDAAMPRLRDMLESQGLNMADVNVSDSGVQGNQAQAGGEGHGGGASSAVPDAESGGEVPLQESMIRVDSQDGVSIYA